MNFLSIFTTNRKSLEMNKAERKDSLKKMTALKGKSSELVRILIKLGVEFDCDDESIELDAGDGYSVILFFKKNGDLDYQGTHNWSDGGGNYQ